MQETQVWSLGQEDPLEKGMAMHSSILAWRIPGMEEPGVLQSMGWQGVGYDWATNTFTFFQRTPWGNERAARLRQPCPRLPQLLQGQHLSTLVMHPKPKSWGVENPIPGSLSSYWSPGYLWDHARLLLGLGVLRPMWAQVVRSKYGSREDTE